MREKATETEDAMAMLATEACKQGLHNLCDGTGTHEQSGEQVACECGCHSLPIHRRPVTINPDAGPQSWAELEAVRTGAGRWSRRGRTK